MTLNRKIRQKVVVWACIQYSPKMRQMHAQTSFASASWQHLNCSYGHLPITQTHANSNQNQFLLDDLHTFTVILPGLFEHSIAQTSSNLKYFLFCFPSAQSFLYNFTLENSNQFSLRMTSHKRPHGKTIEVMRAPVKLINNS